jgi:hypothetical protein
MLQPKDYDLLQWAMNMPDTVGNAVSPCRCAALISQYGPDGVIGYRAMVNLRYESAETHVGTFDNFNDAKAWLVCMIATGA